MPRNSRANTATISRCLRPGGREPSAPHPPALGFARSSVHLAAGPLGDTVTATLDYVRRAPPPSAAATAAGLRTQVKHELALALTDLGGGATFALAYHRALEDERLDPRRSASATCSRS